MSAVSLHQPRCSQLGRTTPQPGAEAGTSPSFSSFQQQLPASSRRDWKWLDTVCGHGSASLPLARTIVSGLGCLLDKVEQCQGTKSTKFLLPVDKQTINSNVVTHSVTRQKIHTFKGEKINKSKCKNIFTTDNWRKTPWKWIIVSAVLMLIINLNCKY